MQESQKYLHDPSLKGILMDSEIWAKLPDHLLENVIRELPIPCLLKFSSVCKSWHSLISSPSFLEAYSRFRSPKPWFLMFTNHGYQDGSTFDPASNNWHRLPLPDLPVEDRYIPVAADGGLVCLSSSTNGHKNFVVCNPLTRAWKKLPSMLTTPAYIETVGMVVDPDRKVYKVVVAGNLEIATDSTITEVYDSPVDSWRATVSMPRGADPLLGTIVCSGIIYSWCSESDGLVAYDTQKDTWTLMRTPIPDSLVSNTILGFRGGIFMIGGLQEGNVTKCICIWELEKSKLEWIEVDRLPDAMCEEFIADRSHFMSVGSNDMVLLYIGEGLPNMPLLLYDFPKRSWRRVPDCTQPDYRISDGLVDGIAFEPRLDIAP